MSQFPRMHVSLYVGSINKTIAFYNSFFGQEPDKIMPNYTKYTLKSPSLIISFVENKERVRPNFGHLGFQVETTEALETLLKSAREKNLVHKEEMDTNCCYANQDKFWVEDPDGHQWEVYYFNHDTSFNDPHYEGQAVSACCMPPSMEEKKKIKLSDINKNACEPSNNCC